MTDRFHQFDCEGSSLAATLDNARGTTGLLIVCGGNELRSGSHAGMTQIAAIIAAKGYPVFRFDRRGIGDSGGDNCGFQNEAPDIAAAAAYFRSSCPQIQTVCAFGNCDAATALILFGKEAGIEHFILANPWVIEDKSQDVADSASAMPASAIRARYIDRLKNPRTFLDLLSGKIDLRKTLGGLKRASQNEQTGLLAIETANCLEKITEPVKILLAKRDTTARVFQSIWQQNEYSKVRKKPNISLDDLDSSSHSFADNSAKLWLTSKILDALERA